MRVGVYFRAANKNQLAEDVQKNVLLDYAKNNHHTVVEVVGETQSGLDTARPGLQHIMNLSLEVIDGVLAKDLGRICRNPFSAYQWAQEFCANGRKLLLMNGNWEDCVIPEVLKANSKK